MFYPALKIVAMRCDMFRKKPEKRSYDKENKKAVLRCSICTGEQAAGFKDFIPLLFIA